MATLMLEPFGGLAGDMLLAALLDLGDPRFTIRDLEDLSSRLVGQEARLTVSEVRRGGMRATHLEVVTPEGADPPQRRCGELLEMLERASLQGRALARARAVLLRLAEAEGEIHGVPPEQVHFHEVGAIDTLVDVAGAAFALERLEVEHVHSTPPLVGAGTVHTAHGVLPVPAPATARILQGIPHRLCGAGEPGERLTPTGAVLLAELTDSFDPPELFCASAIGYGAGTADFAAGPANLLRVQLGDGGVGARRWAWLLEVTLDDTTGEEIGFLLEELRGAGALEAWSAAASMKKGRPGVVVSALAREDARAALERVVLDHTQSLGLRWLRVERLECARETVQARLHGEVVRVKVRRRPGAVEVEALDLSPEHEDLARLARATGRPLRELEREAIEAVLADSG
jgi:uncharacterized protein (TIGR00299 family) protein